MTASKPELRRLTDLGFSKLGLIATACILTAAGTASAEIVSSYDFDGDLSDTLGNGLDLTSAGGTLSAGRYSFANNQGLRLTSALASTTDYAIELRFQVNDNTISWNKLIDYEDLALDFGLYVFEGGIDFWTIGPVAGVVGINTDVTVGIERAGGVVEVFLNGASLFTAIDANNEAVSASNILNFFEDDFATGQVESFIGSVDFIRIHDDASTFGTDPVTSNVFSFAIIPDTQIYIENHPEIFEAQIQWILDNAAADKENIVYVAHLGDLKDSTTCDNPTVTNGSGNNRTEWEIVDDAFERLDAAGIPYGVVPGNHDFDSLFVRNDGVTPGPERCPTWDSTDERPLSLYNSAENFLPTRFLGTSFYGDPMGANNALGQVEPGNRVPGSNEDNFTLFEGTCGLKFVAVNLAYKEGANAIGAGLGGGVEIDWADRLLKLYPDRLGIITSHHFLSQNPDIDPAVGRNGFGGSFGGDYGADVYNGLTDPAKGDNPNLMMMLSAHERGEAWRGFPTNPPDNDNQGALRRAGLQPLHAILSDYQSVIYPDDPDNVDFGRLDGDRGNPGDGGFMRIMRFDPDTEMVEVKTFAPAVSFLDANGNPYTYSHRANAPAERDEVLWSDYFPADLSGSNAVGTRMDKDTASNFSFSFAGYGMASAANTCASAP